MEHIATRPIGTAIAGEAGAELIQIHFADRNGTGVEQPLDHGGRAFGDIRIGGTGGRGRISGQIDRIFNCERDPKERKLFARFPPLFDRPRLG